MAYRVYSAPAGSPEPSPIDPMPGLYKEFTRFDEALAFARHLKNSNRTVLMLEGDDGTRMNRREVVAALYHSEQDLPRWGDVD